MTARLRGHAQIRSDPHSDRILRGLRAAAHAGVQALGNDVGEPIASTGISTLMLG